MRCRQSLPLALVLVTAAMPAAQTSRSRVGTVSRLQAQEIEIRPDGGPATAVKFTVETLFQRVAPGEKDLKKAVAITAADIGVGDRVLLTLDPDSGEARRIVVMPAAEIARRNEADREDWVRRGVAGVVASKSGNQITLRMHAFRGETQVVVTVSDSTTYRRYAPDSVRFADARPSGFAEISPGDQLRARGQKSEDSRALAAGEVVFGTFLTKAGAITAINPQAGEITIKDLATNKPLIVKLAADSQLKRMPAFGGALPYDAPVRAPVPGGPPGPAAAGQSPDLSQMLERMPATRLEDLKPGETIVVSSTKGASRDSITAIMLLANAEMLIRMAGLESGRNQAAGVSPDAPAMSSAGFSGLEMPGMIP